MTCQLPQRDTRAGPVLEISMSCRDLKKLDLFSLSDPFVVLYTRGWEPSVPDKSRLSLVTPRDDAWVYHGETEVIWDCHWPTFARKFYLPDPRACKDVPEDARLRFEVYDADTADMSMPLSSHDFIGTFAVDLTLLGRPDVHVVRSDLADKNEKVGSKLGQIELSIERFRL